MELKDIRKEAFDLAKDRYKDGVPVYNECTSIYLAPTGNVKECMGLYKHAKKVLTVSGIGGFGFEAILNGADKVDMFDLNELQIMFSKMMIESIKTLSYEEFIIYCSLPVTKKVYSTPDVINLFSNDWFERIKYNLPDDVLFVFDPIYDYYDSFRLLFSKLFRFAHCIDLPYLKKFCSWYNKEEYYKLQNILREGKCDINYIKSNLLDLHKDIDNKYDLVCLGNILQYYSAIPDINTPYATNLFIRKKLSQLLNDNGVIAANYGFMLATLAFLKEHKIPYNLEIENPLHRELLEAHLDYEIKTGIDCSLYDKSDNYTYDIINGVEIDEYSKSYNMVLTYHQNRIPR